MPIRCKLRFMVNTAMGMVRRSVRKSGSAASIKGLEMARATINLATQIRARHWELWGAPKTRHVQFLEKVSILGDKQRRNWHGHPQAEAD